MLIMNDINKGNTEHMKNYESCEEEICTILDGKIDDYVLDDIIGMLVDQFIDAEKLDPSEVLAAALKLAEEEEACCCGDDCCCCEEA